MGFQSQAGGLKSGKLDSQDTPDDLVSDAIIVMPNDIPHAPYGVPVNVRLKTLNLTAELGGGFRHDQQLPLHPVSVKVTDLNQRLDTAYIGDISLNSRNGAQNIADTPTRGLRRQTPNLVLSWRADADCGAARPLHQHRAGAEPTAGR